LGVVRNFEEKNHTLLRRPWNWGKGDAAKSGKKAVLDADEGKKSHFSDAARQEPASQSEEIQVKKRCEQERERIAGAAPGEKTVS